MIRAALNKRLSMGADGLYQRVAACMACGHFIEVDTYDSLYDVPCPRCSRICYQGPGGKKYLGMNEDFEMTPAYIQDQVHSMYLELAEITREMPSAEQLVANLEKTAFISARIKTWLWEHRDPIIFYGFFEALRQGGAGEMADALEKTADFDHDNLK